RLKWWRASWTRCGKSRTMSIRSRFRPTPSSGHYCAPAPWSRARPRRASWKPWTDCVSAGASPPTACSSRAPGRRTRSGDDRMLPDGERRLVELTDRLRRRGVVITGEAVVSVAGVDLIYLGLNVVLTAVENLRTRHEPESATPRDQHTA